MDIAECLLLTQSGHGGRPLVQRTAQFSTRKCDILFVPDGVLGVGKAMRRREFVTFLTGTAAIWPLTARAQQSDQMRRIGVMMAFAEDDPEALLRVTTLREELLKLGWTEGRNIRFEQHRSGTDPEAISRVAREIVDTRPDVILADSTPPTAAVLRATHTIPVVFVQVGDPIGSGFVASFQHPDGTLLDLQTCTDIASKWLELLMEIKPYMHG